MNLARSAIGKYLVMNYAGLILFLFLALMSCSSASRRESPCPQIAIYHDEELDLSETETRLICGDKEVAAYRHIPLYQASFMLQGFLESRGYLKPRFETVENVLNVYPGKKITIQKIKVKTERARARDFLNYEMNRLYEDKTLTPETLDAVEGDALSVLREHSYPCAKVHSTAIAEKGIVELELEGLSPYNFGHIDKYLPTFLNKHAFDRFYPFKEGDAFNERLLDLTEKRMLRAGVVGGTYFEESCDENNFSLSQKFIFGPPRTIRFGVGVSTEVGPMIRVRWSHERYKEMASLLETSLNASFRSQSLRLYSDYYFWAGTPRRSLATEFKITREDQTDYEELSAELRPHIKWTRDYWNRYIVWSAGPTLISGRYKTDDDPTAQNFTTGALESGVTLTTHKYESYDIHPEEGEVFTFNLDLRHEALGFIDPLLKINLSYLRLFRLVDWGVGRLIAGLRLNAATTWINDQINLDDLPPSVRHYGGGSDDVRGFELNSLPDNNGLGSLSKLGSKFELRRTRLIGEDIEGFIFFDSVYFGDRSWELQSKLSYSPGVGLRWLSPIGLVQGYYAKAYTTDSGDRGDNFFYVGIGGIF